MVSYGNYGRFEWDERKRELALEKHGIDFLDAVRIFDAPVLEVLSPREGEQRHRAIGLVDGRELAVVNVNRGERRRVITARRARKDERRAYHEYLTGGGDPA